MHLLQREHCIVAEPSNTPPSCRQFGGRPATPEAQTKDAACLPQFPLCFWNLDANRMWNAAVWIFRALQMPTSSGVVLLWSFWCHLRSMDKERLKIQPWTNSADTAVFSATLAARRSDPLSLESCSCACRELLCSEDHEDQKNVNQFSRQGSQQPCEALNGLGSGIICKISSRICWPWLPPPRISKAQTLTWSA